MGNFEIMFADTFKARPSALNDIMTEPRSKSEGLSTTTKSYLHKWLCERMYDRRMDITSKEMQKGILVESESISIYGQYKKIKGVRKNYDRFSNDYLSGVPDIVHPVNTDEVVDIKSSWDLFSFLKSGASGIRTARGFTPYGWQGVGYLLLTKRTRFTLAYILANTPQQLVDDELRRAWYQRDPNMPEEEWSKHEDRIRHLHDFSDMPLPDRVIEFTVKFSEQELSDLEQRIIDRVDDCRAFIEEQEYLIYKRRSEWEQKV